MASWLDLAQDNLAAAQELLDTGRFRSSVSRSYYAAYCAAAHLLRGKVSYPRGRGNPAHEVIPSYLESNLGRLSRTSRQQVRTDYSVLYKARVDADYRPWLSCDRDIALRAKKLCDGILRELGCHG